MRARTVTLIGAGISYAALQMLGRRSGSTASERSAALPGDDLVPHAQMRTDHAVTINATPSEVWPWLTQMGWHLGGWYTPDWVDRLLFPDNWAALTSLDPHLVRDLQVGDVIPDGPPGTAHYVVSQVEAPHRLVLHSTTHIPPGWDTRFGAEFAWTWSFHLTPLPGARTRVHLRVRGRGRPWWFIGLYVAGLIPADYVMATGMLRGLSQRVEAHPAPAASGRVPFPESFSESSSSTAAASTLPTAAHLPVPGPTPVSPRGARTHLLGSMGDVGHVHHP